LTFFKRVRPVGLLKERKPEYPHTQISGMVNCNIRLVGMAPHFQCGIRPVRVRYVAQEPEVQGIEDRCCLYIMHPHLQIVGWHS